MRKPWTPSQFQRIIKAIFNRYVGDREQVDYYTRRIMCEQLVRLNFLPKDWR